MTVTVNTTTGSATVASAAGKFSGISTGMIIKPCLVFPNGATISAINVLLLSFTASVNASQTSYGYTLTLLDSVSVPLYCSIAIAAEASISDLPYFPPEDVYISQCSITATLVVVIGSLSGFVESLSCITSSKLIAEIPSIFGPANMLACSIQSNLQVTSTILAVDETTLFVSISSGLSVNVALEAISDSGLGTSIMVGLQGFVSELMGSTVSLYTNIPIITEAAIPAVMGTSSLLPPVQSINIDMDASIQSLAA